jgi:hypothetical protein
MYGLERLAELPFVASANSRNACADSEKRMRGNQRTPANSAGHKTGWEGPDPSTYPHLSHLSWNWMPVLTSLNALFMRTSHDSLRLLKRVFSMFSLKLFIRFWTVKVASAAG